MNFKKLKRLASALLSFSMLLTMNVPAFAIDLDTVEKAKDGNVALLAELADAEPAAQHDHYDDQGNKIDGTPKWGEWEVMSKPGCETPGFKMRTCLVEFCYEYEVEELPPIGHNYNEGTIEKAATCTEAGIKVVKCQNDASAHGEEPKEEEVPIPMVPHDFTGGKETTIPPTCKTAGQKGIACKFGCGTIDPESLQTDESKPATGHSYKSVNPDNVKTVEDLNKLASNPSAGITVNRATCTSAGSLILECKNKDCDGTDAEKKIEKIIAAPGHSYDKHIGGKPLDDLTAAELQALTTATDDGIQVTKAPSCTTPGSVEFECKNSWDTASSKKTKEIPPLGHDWDEGVVTKQPSCGIEGLKTSTCQRCDITSGVAIKATGHSFGDYKIPAQVTNDLLKELASDPSNAAKGIIAQPANCTSKGSLTVKCTKEDCDKTSGASDSREINALGHVYDQGRFLPGEEATCLKDGQKTYTCIREGCDEGSYRHSYKEEVKASGHSYGTIKVDEEKMEVEASALKGLTTDEAKGILIEAGSCTATGKLTLTCKNENCDDHNAPKVYTILPSDHTWSRKTYREMTCKNASDNPQTGMVLKTCDVCKTTEWEVIPVAHSYEAEGWFDTPDAVYTVISNRTCTTNGKVIPTCDVCGKNDEEIVFPMTGHSYDAEDYSKPDKDKATLEDLKAAGVEEEAYKAATCTSAGYQYYKCQNAGDCGATKVKAVKKFPIEQKAHKYATTATTKAATCTKPEITAKFCENPGCDAYDESDAVIGAGPTGHSFKGKQRPTMEQIEEAGIEDVTSENDLSFKGDCLTDGYDYYICDKEDCDKGENYISKIVTKAPGSHDMQPNEKTIPATCSHPEQMHETCSRCGYDEVIPTPPELEDQMEGIQPHEFTKLIRIVAVADCTEGATRNGIAEYGCEYGCGETQLKVTLPEHQWKNAEAADLDPEDYESGDSAPSKDATCNAAGYQYKICTVCKKVVKEAIPQLEHQYELATADDNTAIGEDFYKASDCTNNGYQYYRCTQPTCKVGDKGHFEKRDLPLDKTKHNYQDNQDFPASCTEPRKTGRLCTLCHEADPDQKPTIIGDPLGHADERAGFNKEGTPENPLGDYAKLPVSTLMDLQAEGITGPVSKAATCTQPGYEYHSCDQCIQGTSGHAIKVVKPALDHEYTFTEIPSTCTQPGILLTKCERCGEETRQEISSQPALGHDFQEYPLQDATCHDEGKTAGWECSRCGEADSKDPSTHPARQTISIDSTKHVWEKKENDDRNQDPVCGSDQTAQPGMQIYTCKYHPETERVVIVPPVHQWGAPVMQNCVNNTRMPGVLYHQCAVCKEIEVMKYLTDCVECEDASHVEQLKKLQETDSKYQVVVVKPTTIPAIAATCTAKGKTEGKTCTCGTVLTPQTETGMIPHDGDFAIKDAGDCGHDGIKQRKCKVCGTYYGEEVTFPSENSGKHTYKAVITDATCTVPMKVQEVCEVCGQSTPVREVPGTKLPHQFNADGVCTVCQTPEIKVTTVATTSDEGGNNVVLTNELEINNPDKYELLEAGVIYYLSQSAINAADTPEKLEAMLDFDTALTSIKVASETDKTKLANLVKYSQPILVGSRTDNKIAARAFLRVKVDGKEEYRYGNVIVRSYNEVFYPASE